MKILNIFLLLIFHLIKESLSYNDSIPFNWTKELDFCYREDFELNDLYRPFYPDIYPIRGCSFDEKNRLYEEKAYKAGFGLTNITYEPKLDFFFPRQEYPPLMRDPPTSMTFRLTGKCPDFESFFISHSQTIRIYFGRADDYLPIPKNSKKTGQAIQYNGKKAILKSRFKIAKSQLLYIYNENEFDFSKNDYELLEYEGEEFNSYFDGYELDFSNLQNTNYFSNSKTNDPEFCNNPNDIYALLIKVYDLPRMKVQGLFQYNYSILSTNLQIQKSFIYTVDTRNIFFQNISMFYNQHVNVSADFDEPTAEDSGIWINTTCNTPNVATIMVDYFFFETIHKMQSFGYEFGDRFQLRIHTPWYRKTLNKRYSLFRYQWNSSYEKPRVFIHPISKYRDYCLTSGNNNTCPRMFNFTKWSTDPLFTQFIIDIKHEIIENEIRINFTELEKIYEADGFQRTKLSINVNNTMAPHISQVTNGLWAELIDTVTNDWVMKTKTTMDEVYGYSGDKEPDPYRDFYLTCEIPDNITKDEVEIKLKRSGAFSTIHLWIKLDVFKKGITKMFPPRFNTIIKFPPQVRLTNRTFMYTYQYYRIPGGDEANWHYLIKDLRQTGLADGTITDETFDVGRNMVNISELHPNIPNGDDAMFYNQTYDYFCHEDFIKDQDCLKLENRRLYLYYFFDLEVEFIKNDTCPLEMIVYYVKYVPHHSKDQINRAIHRWNQHHAGWVINSNSIYEDSDNKKSFRYYYEPEQDNFFYREKGTNTYENKFGSSGVLSYGGPDCVFNFAGGSTLRNKTCEYWAGIIPDQPFTNYARDIVEEYVAYRTSKYEQAFRVHTYDDVKIEIINLKNLEPYPGKFTSIILEALFHDKDIPDALIDGEPTCGEFYEYPKVCEGSMNDYKPITNIYNHTKEYFVKIKLPKGIVASSESYGLADQCMRDNKYLRNNKYEYRDYLCLYFNQSFIYAFNSLSQWGFTKSRGIYDIKIHIDGLYIPENITELERESGRLEFGFFRSTFFYTEFPRLNKEDHKLYIKNNYTFGILKTEPKNEQKNAQFSVFINAKNIYDEDSVFIIDFPNEIEFAEAQGLNIGNAFLSDTALEVLRKNNYFSKINDNTNFILENLHINNTNIFNNTFVVYPFYDEKLSNYYNEENEDYNIEIIFYINNYRSFKPIEINVYRTNDSFITLFQHEKIIMNNSIPEKISNASLTIDTYYTSDRAIYTLEFYTDVDYIYEDDYLEYLTSWRSNFSNTEYNESYFKYRVKIDKNYTKWEKITVILNPVINPETLDDQYLQVFRILDKEGYVIAVSNDNDNIMSLKMKKYISFKYSEIITEKTDKDYNIFNITVNLVPEVLTKGNDTLRLKFSKNVLFKDVPNINIVGIKGISSYSNDINVTNQYQMEYNEEDNEIIITNAFPPIAESQFVFDNFTANALVDQELIFTFTDIPIKQINTTDEALFSVEAKTEAECEGKIITRQINTIPGVALFCGFTCRTCEKDNMQRCILCKESYPYLLTTIYKCISMCPDGFYVLEKEHVIECNKCLEPCSTCYENETNCTGCIEGYFLENNTCVQNCSENFAENEEEQRCYPILYLNETTFNDTYEYINVSVPTPYDVYINHNVCIFIDEEEEEKIINEYEDEIFKNIEEELNEDKIEIEQNEIIEENEKDIKTEKELEIQKEETEKEYIKEYEKLKENKYEREKEKEVELVNQNLEEKQKEMLEEYNEIEAESSIKIIEKELENKKEKFEIIEEEMIPEAVIEKESEIIKENIEENIKENLEENIEENIQENIEENIEENIKEKELEIIKLIEKEKNKENDIEYEKEIEKEMLLKNEKEKEEEYENEMILSKEKKYENEIEKEVEYEKEIIIEKEKKYEKEIFLEKEEEYENEIILEKEMKHEKEIILEKEKKSEKEIILEKEEEYEKEIILEKEKKYEKEIRLEKEKENEMILDKEEEYEKEIEKKEEDANEIIIEKEEEDENEMILDKEEEYEKQIIIEKEKKYEKEIRLEKEDENEMILDREEEYEKELILEKEKKYEKEIFLEKEEDDEKEKEIILEKEKKYEIESSKETAIQNDTETEKEKIKELEEKIIENQKEYIEENEKEIKIQPFNEIEKEKEKEIYDFEEEQENKEILKEIKEKNKEIELEKLEKEIAKEEEIENINKREEEYLAEIDEEKEKKIESEKINEKELEKEIEEKNIENEKQYIQEREIMKEKMKEKEKEIEKEYEIESEKIDEKEIEKKKELIIQKEEEIEKEIIGEQKIELLEKELKSEELIIEEEKYQKEKENYRYTDEIFIDDIEEYEEEISNNKIINEIPKEKELEETERDKEKDVVLEEEKEIEKEKAKDVIIEKEKEIEKDNAKDFILEKEAENEIENESKYEEEIASEKSDKIIIQDNDMDLKPMCNPYFFDNLPHIFKYKNPFDYYLIPIISGLILLLLEILFCCKILNLSFYFLTYFILGIIFKILLILVFAYSFTTGYEYFFYTVAIIFMIYMFITMTFLLFNLCNKNSLNDLKTNYKCLWLLSLIGCLVSDYRCLELFTRTKIEIIDSNYRNKKGEIIKNNKNRKYNYKNNIDNNLDYTTNDNDDTDAHFKTIFKNRKIIEDKNTSTQNSFDNSNGLFNLNGIKKNNLNLNEIKDKDDKSENKDKAKFNEYKEYEKYFLVQESCINKTIIIFDLLFVYLAFIVICLYMIYKYKTYSTLWFLSIYGVIFAIINIIYYFRFKYIKINNRNEENKKEKIIKIKQKQRLGNNITQNKEILSNTSPQKLPTNHQKNIGSSFGKLLGTNNSIKEDLHEDDKTQNEKKINKFDNNITNINIIKNDINQINLDKNMKPMDMENDDDIIYNPYREDFIPESAASKKSKNNKNMDIPELKLKDIKNNNENNIGEEYNILKTYRSLESEDYKIGSIDSKNNINNLKKFDTKIFHKSNEKQNEEKLDDDDEDNTSVIHNPLRDDI